MPTYCVGYADQSELAAELQRKLDELYTPAPVPVHPDFDRSCKACEKNGGCCGFCDTAKNASMSYAEFKERTELLERLMFKHEEITERARAESSALYALLEALKERVRTLEDALFGDNNFTTITAEPLNPLFEFNLRETFLQMQADRMRDGGAPHDARLIAAAIKAVDDALSPPVTASVGFGVSSAQKMTSRY